MDMERLLKLLQIPLFCTGFDVLSEFVTIWHTFRRWLYYICGTILIIDFTYNTFISDSVVPSDRLFLFNAGIAYIAIVFQGYLFWYHKEKLVLIFKEIRKVHETREELWIESEAKILFDDCFRVNLKISKIATGLILGNAFGTPITPIFYATSDYMYPMELAISGDPTTNYYINFGMQSVCFIYIVIFYLTNFFVFFLFSVNVSYELKFIAQICEKFGSHEDLQMDVFEEEEKTRMISKKTLRNPRRSKKTQDKTSILLKTVVKYHTNALSLSDVINDVYLINIAIWEFLAVLSICNLFLLLSSNLSRSIGFIPILGASFLQYFLVSRASAQVKEGFEMVGQSLYSSKWYLLKPSERKDFLMVLTMGQKIKALTVGPFGYSTLDRFTTVVKVSYQICLLMKNFLM